MKWSFGLLLCFSCTVLSEKDFNLGVCVKKTPGFEHVHSERDTEFVRNKGGLIQGIIYRKENSLPLHQDYINSGYIIQNEGQVGDLYIRWLTSEDSRYDYVYTFLSIEKNGSELALYEFDKAEAVEFLSTCLPKSNLVDIGTFLE